MTAPLPKVAAIGGVAFDFPAQAREKIRRGLGEGEAR